jgi:Large ribosomal RNA subunit accumulation protein YceD
MNDKSGHMIESVPITRRYDVEQVSSAGIISHLEADNDQCERIAEALDLLELEIFRFEYQLQRISKRRFKLKGQLLARAMQSCVVTLEPVPVIIEEKVEINLWPLDDVERLEAEAEPKSMSVQMDGPEPISGDIIDVGQLAYEHFAAALDLYPKKANAMLDLSDQAVKDDDAGSKPFAALAKLKEMSGPDSN